MLALSSRRGCGFEERFTGADPRAGVPARMWLGRGIPQTLSLWRQRI